MLGILKDSFNITNRYFVLVTPLIFFSLISNLYMIFSGKSGLLSIIFTLIMFFLMVSAFLSGWFYMIKKAVMEPEHENADALITEFPAGVGEYFLSIPGMILISTVITILIMSLTYFACTELIGNFGITHSQIVSFINSTQEFVNFMQSLNAEQLMKLSIWYFLFLGALLFVSFLNMLYAPCIMFKSGNPLKAFFICLKDLFSRKFFLNLSLFVIIILMHGSVSLISFVARLNIVLYFVVTLLNFYFITYIAVLTFNYYYTNFAKIGANVDKTV